MDQIKIGRFISECRKKEGLTQVQLAEKLNITDRAVSKWETGRSLPDSSIMLELCEILKIGVNDLLCGEVVKMENENIELEKNLMDMIREKEESDRRLLFTEYFVGGVILIFFLALVLTAVLSDISEGLQIVLILIGVAPIIIAAPFMLRIEQKAGYYKCSKCSHRYVPKYVSVFSAMHFGRTRFMKCPHCGKYSWQKKVIEKEEKR